MPNPLTLGMHEINAGCADCTLVLDFNCSRGHIPCTIDSGAVRIAVKDTGLIATIVEHTIHGKLGSAIAEVLVEKKNLCARLLRFGAPDDIYKSVGSQSFCLEASGLSMRDLVGAIYDNIVRGKQC